MSSEHPKELPPEIAAANSSITAFAEEVMELAKARGIPIVSLGVGLPTSYGTLTARFRGGDKHVLFTLARMAIVDSDPIGAESYTVISPLAVGSPNRERMS